MFLLVLHFVFCLCLWVIPVFVCVCIAMRGVVVLFGLFGCCIILVYTLHFFCIVGVRLCCVVLSFWLVVYMMRRGEERKKGEASLGKSFIHSQSLMYTMCIISTLSI